ncbi:MAG: hypothetical protein LKK54_04240 [Ancrocorticia sp.]|jgi:hypothetical protein|nr:hypothetical protein [Ancrocorticia sp.]MCI2178653.1 hypothetical protein [Ancrocorticia sp.]MCI2192627.1 hypothetical protein [Ancrocorticia sp.]MCI2198927.1 hypothetical protein [Ancrocorticia sp.]
MIRRPIPAQLRAYEGKLLGFARISDQDYPNQGAIAAAYPDRLVIVPDAPGEGPSVVSVVWSEFEGAGWDGDAHRLTLRFVDNRRAPLVMTLQGKAGYSLALIVRERVEYSIVFQQQANLPSGAIAHGMVRRGPDEVLFTEVIVDGDTSAADDVVVAQLEASLRDVTGLAPDA